MQCAKIVSLQTPCHVIIAFVVADGRVFHSVAIAAVAHICSNISLIVAEIDRLRLVVAGRVVVPIPGRYPRMVVPHAEVREDAGLCVKYGTDEERRTIYVRRSYNLHVE